MGENFLEIVAVHKSYETPGGSIDVLQDVSLTVAAGEIVALMGASGSGKSTLLSIAGGMETPSGGSVRIMGQEISSLTSDERAALRRSSIGYIFQDFNLIPALTTLDNVSLPLELDGMATKKAHELSHQALHTVGLKTKTNSLPDVLSGGERQRAAVARAVVGERGLLLADEPTGSLDSENGEVIVALLRDLAVSGAAVLLVTHDPAIATSANRIVEIVDGRIVEGEASGTNRG